jgi:hypothetical protein
MEVKKHTNHAYVLKEWKRNAGNNNKSSLFSPEAFYDKPGDYKLVLHLMMMIDSAHDLLDRGYAIHDILQFKKNDFKSGWTNVFGSLTLDRKFLKSIYALMWLYGYDPADATKSGEMVNVIKKYGLIQDVEGQAKSAAPPATTIEGARLRMMGHINDIFLTPKQATGNNNKTIARDRGGYAVRMMGRAELQQFLLARIFAVDAGFKTNTHHLLGMTLTNGSKNAGKSFLTSAVNQKKTTGWSQLTNSASTTNTAITIPSQAVNNKTEVTVPDAVRPYLSYEGAGRITMKPVSQSMQFRKITKYVDIKISPGGPFPVSGSGSFILYRTRELDLYVTTSGNNSMIRKSNGFVQMVDPNNTNGVRRIYIIDTGPKFKGPSMDALMQVAVHDSDENNNSIRPGIISACLDIKRDGDMGQMEANVIENEIRMGKNEEPIFLLTGDITAMILGVMKGASTVLVMSEGTYLMYCPLAVEYKTHYVTYRKMVDQSKKLLQYYLCQNNMVPVRDFINGVLDNVEKARRKSSIYSASRFINKLNNVGPFLTSSSQNLSTKWKALNATEEVTAFKDYFKYALEMPTSALYTAAIELLSGGKDNICKNYTRPSTTIPNAVTNNTIPNALKVKRNNKKKKTQNNKIVGVRTRAMTARNSQMARNAKAANNAWVGVRTRAMKARNAKAKQNTPMETEQNARNTNRGKKRQKPNSNS